MIEKLETLVACKKKDYCLVLIFLQIMKFIELLLLVCDRQILHIRTDRQTEKQIDNITNFYRVSLHDKQIIVSSWKLHTNHVHITNQQKKKLN